MIYSLLLGFSAITLKADQTIGGTALNMLATAIAIVLVKAFNNGSDAALDASMLSGDYAAKLGAEGRRCSSSTPTARRATPCRRGRNTTCPTRSARWTRTAT